MPLISIEQTEFVIVVQKWQDNHKTEVLQAGLPSNVHIEWDDGVGLSRSRNLAIKQSLGQFFWLLDDDVQIDEKFVK